ncbi:MAG: sugar ABC transporter permease [SAR324 cluster bacterium]|nr:sugar ABC transporter permease [Pseudomonadota bacterium]MBI11680.1 sugar ABC transporter permease [Deltaproteobacteria bacterium]MDP6091429.1 sugar ABC transporter permease [SAR324 cluster bacterium]MBP44238.1 sugar ABC transporter permease [Deltaproteobacteria bacterium]MDP6248190.1 sugar ABC transporter permease [SAR324 cluster bacterium]
MRKDSLAVQEARFGWQTVLPSLTVITLLILYPVLYNIYLSFFEVKLVGENVFVGPANYLQLLSDVDFFRSLWTTAVYVVASTLGTTLLGLAVASLMNHEFPLRNLVRGLILLPYIAPLISEVFAWQFIFDPVNGIYNYMMVEVLQLSEERVNLIGTPDLALLVVVVFDIWKNFPFAYLLILARLQSIDHDLYEAAEIDGAGRWKKFLHITLPEIRFVVGAIIMLRFIWNMNKFDEVFLLTPNVKTLPVYTYFTAFTGSIDQGQAASIAVVQFLLLIVMIFYYIRRVLKW